MTPIFCQQYKPSTSPKSLYNGRSKEEIDIITMLGTIQHFVIMTQVVVTDLLCANKYLQDMPQFIKIIFISLYNRT